MDLLQRTHLRLAPLCQRYWAECLLESSQRHRVDEEPALLLEEGISHIHHHGLFGAAVLGCRNLRQLYIL
jgi:hypothetical protein